MTLADRLRRLADAADGEDLAGVLGVAPAALQFGPDGLTIEGEAVTWGDVRRALMGVDLAGAGRSVRIEDLEGCRTSSPT